MTDGTDIGGGGGRRGSRWTLAVWGVAALLLITPAIGMQVSDGWAWGPADFGLLAVLLAAVCGAIELAVRASGSLAYRAGVGLAVVTAFLVVWINLAVGMIGAEGHPANLMFGAVLILGAAGAVLARFQPKGLAWTLAGMALAHAAVAGVAVAWGLKHPLPLSAAFVVAWLAAAGLFWKAAQAPPRPTA